MKPVKKILAALSLAFLSTAVLAQSPAANFPNKPMRIIVPLGSGGPTDLFARMFAAHLEKKYRQPALVENKPGAGQLVGANLVAKADPDGYTLLAASSNLPSESLLTKDAPLDTAKDILPFGIIAGSGLFIGVHSSIPVKNMQEFVAWVKANPGKLNQGTASAPLVAIESLRDRLGLNWVNVNYKGGAAAMTALIAGEVQLYTPDVNQAVPPMKEGRVRILAYSDQQRHSALPEIPTIAESGIGAPDFVLQVWLGMFAHQAVPNDIIAKLNADVNEMSALPESTARFTAMGWRAIPSTVTAIRRGTTLGNEQVAALLAKGVKLR